MTTTTPRTDHPVDNCINVEALLGTRTVGVPPSGVEAGGVHHLGGATG